MTSLTHEEYDSFRRVVLFVCMKLKEKGYKPYSEPFDGNGTDFDSPEEALKKNFAVLDQCRYFVLLYTHTNARSSLIELGYALKCHIPIYIFAKEGVTVPFYLRSLDQENTHQIQIVTIREIEDLPSVVDTTMITL